jgi:hypothetical protein
MAVSGKALNSAIVGCSKNWRIDRFACRSVDARYDRRGLPRHQHRFVDVWMPAQCSFGGA